MGIVEVATIDDDGITKGLVEPVQVEGGEFRPVGEDEQRIGIPGGSVGVVYVAKIGAGWQHLLGASGRGGVVGGAETGFAHEPFDAIAGRPISHVTTLAPAVPAP